jgi:UDP-N-acetylmuramate dehydrogenase
VQFRRFFARGLFAWIARAVPFPASFSAVIFFITTLNIQENIPLAPLTTLQVGGLARYFVSARTEAEVGKAVAYASGRKLALFVLGGGSNLVISDSGWPGLVLKVAVPGVAFESDSNKTFFSAGAGESWDDFVAFTVAKDCAGLECLSGIPGTVGGTPVQNVGAYGQEVSQTIATVRVLEIATGKIRELNNADCGFAYRTSIFNSGLREKCIVLEVGFRLERGRSPAVEYADLKRFFTESRGDHPPTLQQVRDAVRSIRQSKAMLLVTGDEDCRSAGSFFKNPVVSRDEADRIQAVAEKQVPGKMLPSYPAQDGHVKLAAAWLVEQAGFHKGYARGPVGISRKHALAIVNRGGATARDIIALKDEIQATVLDVWGVQLQPEPVFVGFED